VLDFRNKTPAPVSKNQTGANSTPSNSPNHEITAPHPLGHRLPVFHLMRHADGLLSEMREGLML
jgi:hypothetical protein